MAIWAGAAHWREVMEETIGHLGEAVPCFAARVDDGVVALEDTVRESVRRRYCQTFSTGFSSGL